MPHPILLRASLAIALVRAAQRIVPALVIAATLYACASLLNVPFDRPYIGLAAVAAVLSAILMRPPDGDFSLMRMDSGTMAVDLMLRWGLTAALLLSVGYLSGFSEDLSRRVVLPWLVSAPLLALLTSLVLRTLMRKVVITPDNERTAVMIGMNLASLQLADRMLLYPEMCTRVEGFFDDRGPERLGWMGTYRLLGRLADLVQYVQTHRIDIIFVALPIRHMRRVMALLEDLHDSTASIYYVPDVFVFDLIQSRTADVMGVPVVAMRETPFFGYRGVVKRVTDIVFTLMVLSIAIVPMAVIALVVKLTSSGPAIFRQRRYGLNGEEIVVYKFRTMRVAEDGAEITQATRDDPRVTPVGGLLRRFSLDELPQLINVLQGRMSLVGPRPHAVTHNEQYRRLIKGYMIRHKVLPGITGLAQVNGCRGETSELTQMQQRVNFDLEYLRYWSPALDLKILIRTAIQTFFDRKAY